MLLGNQKEKGQEQNWCVILNAVSSAIDKKRMAQKMSEAFGLASDESADLVNSTPIILLDHLTKSMATKIKQYFHDIHAEFLLTNDVLRKRKYYRTVWPEPPSLSFLHQWEPSKTVADDDEALSPDQALDEIRSIREDADTSSKETYSKHNGQKNLTAEIERWKKEYFTLHEELDRLRHEIQSQPVHSPASVQESKDSQRVAPQEMEIKELKDLLSHADEKYDALKEEYGEARGIFEKKIVSQDKDTRSWQQKIKEKEDQIHVLNSEKQSRQDSLMEKENTFVRIQDESKGSDSDLIRKEVSEWKARAIESDKKYEALDREKSSLRVRIAEQTQEMTQWKERYAAVTHELQQTRKTHEMRDATQTNFEKRRSDLDNNQISMMNELEARSQKSRDWEMQFLQLEKKLAELRVTCENQEKLISTHWHHLESKEKELEGARIKLKKAQGQLEEQETDFRKSRVEERLVQNQNRLHELIEKQKSIESTIRSGEEAIRRNLTSQEHVEQAIMKDKQERAQMFGTVREDPPHQEPKSPSHD